jgi:hypothetical protein
MAEIRNAYVILMRKIEGKRILGRPRCSGRILKCLTAVCEGVGGICVVQDRNQRHALVTMLVNFWDL